MSHGIVSTARMSRRSLLKLAAALAAGTVGEAMVGCAAPAPASAPTAAPPKDVTFTLMHRYFWDPTGSTFDSFVTGFQQEYPHIKLEKNVYGDEDYKSTIKVAMPSDKPPDLFYAYGGNWLKFFVDQGLVADISSYYAQYKWEERLNPRALREVKYGGKYYAVPTELTTAGIYYNKTIFKQVGIEPGEIVTWDEFLGYCKKIKDAGFQAMCLGDKEGSWIQWWWDYSIVREMGNDYRKKVVRGEIPINDKGVVAALDRIMTDIFFSGYMNENIVGLDIFGWLGMMAEGKTGMTLVHSFIPPQLIVAMQAEPFDLGFFMYPQVDSSIPIANDFYVEGNQCMSAKCQYPDEGAKWLDYVISPEVQTEWAKISWIPTVQSAESALPELTKGILATVEKYDTFAHLGLVFHPELETALYANLQAILSKELTPQQGMDAVQKVAETVPWVGVPQGEAG